jgi:hypothetical protein
MDDARVRARAKRLKAHATMRPFRTATGALAAGCLLLGVVTFLHEESPAARLVAERAADDHSNGRATRGNGYPTGPQSAYAANASPKDLEVPLPRSTKNAGRFWNASRSASQPDRGPAIQLGPPLGAGDAAADPASRVTRTYRPTSMSAASLERLVRPLLTARGETIAANAGSPVPKEPSHAAASPATISDADSSDRLDVLIVSDRPEAIGRVDALCRDIESTSPRIAIDLVVLRVLPTAGRQLPWDQWRSSFGIVDSELPTVLTQIRGLGHTTLQAASQLQTLSGAWTELEWSEQDIGPSSSRAVADDSADSNATNAPLVSRSYPMAAITTLHIRPSSQSEGLIRIEIRAQSSHSDDHAHAERPQVVAVRFNTEVVLREGATGVINLFVDEPFNTGTHNPPSPIDAAAAFVIPGGPFIPATKIVPQPSEREQTLLLLMPRIAAPPRSAGKVAASKTHHPS